MGDDPIARWTAYVNRLVAAVGLDPGPPLPAVPAAAPGPGVLLCAPHPDDEALTGGLALRLAREGGCVVTALAVTLGSAPHRRQERWQEFQESCRLLGFTAESLALDREAGGLAAAARRPDSPAWHRWQAPLAAWIAEVRPWLVIAPHAGDLHPTHQAVAQLVRHCLAAESRSHDILLAETEYWFPLRWPNLAVACSVPVAARLCAAAACHRGEMARQPYHRLLPLRLADNRRRAAELLSGFGAGDPGCAMVELYRLRRYRGGRPISLSPRSIPTGVPLVADRLA